MCISQPAVYRRCLYRYDHWKHAIIDCGIEIFLSGQVDEYPVGYHKDHIEAAKKLTEDFGLEKIWVTIPDFPDDYNPGHLGDNVGRTLRNIEIYHNIKGINWIYPLQAQYLKLNSFRRSCEAVREYEPERVAIGTVCKTRNTEFIIRCTKMARRYFPDSWIHAFGPTLRALPKMVNYLDSFDTTAYYYNPETGEQCKNREERGRFFGIYKDRVDTIIKNQVLQPLTAFATDHDTEAEY